MIKIALPLVCGASLGAADCTWSPTTWNGESAQASESGGWRAIVSLERGRLVHFGPVGSEANLVFAPAVRGEETGWGGHIVWLGPQGEWPVIWPPDAAWERSGSATCAVRDGWLELTMPESGGGWAHLVRGYAWSAEGLLCRVSLLGGTHAAQVMQIVQVPASAVVRVATAVPDETTPAGFALLKVGAHDQVVRTFPWPAHASRRADSSLELRPTGAVVKVAFTPQPLVATAGGFELTVAPVGEAGAVAGLVDHGLNTQLYLGREGTPFIELEQLSSRFVAGGEASATIVLRGQKVGE